LGIQATWRSARAAARKANSLTAYSLHEIEQIQAVAERLNKHSFDLQRTGSKFFPRLERMGKFLPAPLVAASLPWVLRRFFGQPLRKRP
jgi:hypothetical protein